MSETDGRRALIAAYENAADVVSAITSNQLMGPTPCPGYNVAALIDHLVEAGNRAAALGAGQVPPPGDESPHVDLADAPARLRRASQNAKQAWADPSRRSATYTMPWGQEYSGATLIGMYVAELAAHAWDLARATGNLERLDADLPVPALVGAREMIRPEFRNAMGPGSPYGSEVPSEPDFDGWDRLVAFMGRDPRALHGSSG